MITNSERWKHFDVQFVPLFDHFCIAALDLSEKSRGAHKVDG